MIVGFRHKGLRDLFDRDSQAGVRPDLADRCRARLAAIHAAGRIEDLAVPGWRLHRLLGEPPRWSLTVNGPWRITFAWDGQNAAQLDLEQYH